MTNIGKMLFAIIAITFMAMSQPLCAQSTSTSKDQKPEKALKNELVEEQATYPDGETGLLKDIASNLKYPEKAVKQGKQGMVVLRFFIKEDGSIGDIQIKKSVSPECDEAAVNAVKKLRKFTPAKQKGKPVAVWFTLPVMFKAK